MNSVLLRPAELSITQVLQSERGRLIKSQESNRWSLWREWYLPWWKQVPGESFWLYKAARQLESEFTLASNGSLGLRQSAQWYPAAECHNTKTHLCHARNEQPQSKRWDTAPWKGNNKYCHLLMLHHGTTFSEHLCTNSKPAGLYCLFRIKGRALFINM